MLLEELLFCVVFIVLPLLGMIGAGVKKALNDLNRKRADKERVTGKEERLSEAIRCFKGIGAEKQLGGETVYLPINHLLINFIKRKIRTHPRAGP